MAMKKIISIALTFALLLTTCLIVGMFPVKAETTKTWLDFEAKEMPYYIGDTTSWDAWSIDPSTPYNCAAWNSWGYSQQNGAWTIRELVVPSSGTLTVEAIWGAAGYYHGGGESDTIQFAIANDDKELVYPATGDLETIEYNEKINPQLSISVEAGDSIYFIMGNPSKAGLSYYMSSIIRVNGTQLQGSNGWHYGNTDGMGVQGGVSQNGAKWYYKYADSVTVTNNDPDGYTDRGGDIYAADYTVQEMKKISTANGDSNNGYIGGGTYGKTTFAQSQNVYLKTGETAIVRYTATADGTFDIGYCGVKLMESTNAVGAWGDDQGCDFMILDNDGKVIYPEYGGPAQLRGTDTPTDNATVPSRLYHYNMKQGEHLDFVFKPTATLPSFGTAYVNMSGSFSFNGSRIDASGRLNLSPSEAQGKRGVTMLYSTDFVVSKLITDEWTDYVQLSKPFTAAPATVEAYVNIPANTPDWKQGVILSDMGGADEENGFEFSVDYFGHPRLVLAGGSVDVTFDAVDIRTGKWEHIAYTYDAATGEAKFYLNGLLADSKTATAAALSASARKAVIGNDMTYTKSSAFQGAMKKLAVYSDIRTIDEIAADMASVSASAEGLIGYWVLNGSYTDKSSNANTGVLTNVGSAWYKADAPADAEAGEFTVVHIGDMQVSTDFIFGMYPMMTEWLAANKDRLNIQMVVNTGDLVNYEATASQWVDAKSGMNHLTNANIPFVFAAGNHEYPSSGTKERDPSTFNSEYPISTYFTQDGGEGEDTQVIYAYPNTEKLTTVDALTNETLENAIYLKYINGIPYIYVAVEVEPRDIVVEWLNVVMPKVEAEYTNAVTTVLTHNYLTAQGKLDTFLSCFTEAHRLECNSPAEFFENFVSKYKSIQLVLSGHVASDVATRTDIGVNGNKIMAIMNDPSYEGDGGNGVMLFLRYKADGTIKAEYYSPLLDAYYKANSQFDFDTAEVETKLNISEVKDMTYCRSDVVWFRDSNFQGGHYIAKNYLHTYQNNAVIKAYTAPVSGNISFTVRISDGGANQNRAEYIICKSDGTILKPWQPIADLDLPNRTNKVYDVTVRTDIIAGEAIYCIYRDPSKVASTVNTTQWGTLVPADGSANISISSSNMTATKGENGWSCHYVSGTSLTEVAVSSEVSYSAAEGGTITAQTGGTWAADKLTIANGGTAYFTTKPAPGYKFAGYYIDGKLCSTNRRLVYANVTSDMVVEARFEKIKKAGDTNLDGEVDVLDLLIATKFTERVKPEMTDLYDDNMFDEKDTAALRAELLK